MSESTNRITAAARDIVVSLAREVAKKERELARAQIELQEFQASLEVAYDISPGDKITQSGKIERAPLED